MKKLKYIICVMTLFVLKMNVAFADVSFNQGQATSDVNNLVAPISAFIFGIATAVTGLSMAASYISWHAKDEEEREQKPYLKIIKRHIMAFVFFLFSTVILTWFSIS